MAHADRYVDLGAADATERDHRVDRDDAHASAWHRPREEVGNLGETRDLAGIGQPERDERVCRRRIERVAVESLVDLAEGTTNRGREPERAWRRHDAATAARDDRIADRVTQAHERVADGRRCDVEPLRRPHHALLGEHCVENEEQVEVERR